MSPVARVAAQAKVNLVLHILAREESGYHGIETVFARLLLADLVTVRVTARGRSIDCQGASVGPAESNLAYRAAVTFADAAGWPAGFAIELEKRIPVGGGMGGGSADAGAVLRALNAMAPRPLASGRLLGLAGALGADVPFLTTEYPLALAWGRGERMLALRPLPAAEVDLVCFPFGVATAAAYEWLAGARRESNERTRPRILDPGALASWDAVAGIAANDFEGVVVEHHPPIRDVLAAVRARGAAIVQLSGSGSTVFVIKQLPAADGGGTGGRAPASGEGVADLGVALPDGAFVVRTATAEVVAPVERLD
jgi:4-diphosphocytidyl-2-C-methyl-D-erythritol kinase